MRSSTARRIDELEERVRTLRAEMLKTASRCNHIEDGLQQGPVMGVPLIRDGGKIGRSRPGSYPQIRQVRHRDVKISSVINLLAEKVGVELVYHDDVPGKLGAASVNEFSEPEE